MDTKEMLIKAIDNGGMFENEHGGIVKMDKIDGLVYLNAHGKTLHPISLTNFVLGCTWKPYVKPVDWSKVPIDTKVLCRTGGQWVRRHFAGISKFNGRPTTWAKGGTSWSRDDSREGWDEIKLAE